MSACVIRHEVLEYSAEAFIPPNIASPLTAQPPLLSFALPLLAGCATKLSFPCLIISAASFRSFPKNSENVSLLRIEKYFGRLNAAHVEETVELADQLKVCVRA
jgi:hypothetical protein